MQNIANFYTFGVYWLVVGVVRFIGSFHIIIVINETDYYRCDNRMTKIKIRSKNREKVNKNAHQCL